MCSGEAKTNATSAGAPSNAWRADMAASMAAARLDSRVDSPDPAFIRTEPSASDGTGALPFRGGFDRPSPIRYISNADAITSRGQGPQAMKVMDFTGTTSRPSLLGASGGSVLPRSYGAA